MTLVTAQSAAIIFSVSFTLATVEMLCLFLVVSVSAAAQHLAPTCSVLTLSASPLIALTATTLTVVNLPIVFTVSTPTLLLASTDRALFAFAVWP